MARLLLTIPTFNEERVITRSLEIASDRFATSFPNDERLIDVADNGSTDRTPALVEAFAKDHSAANVRLRRLSERGKGLAIRRSWESHANECDVLLFTDVDLAADLEALPTLVRPILDGEADIVCGSRFVPGAEVQRGAAREIASRAYRLLQHALLHLPVEDAQCGLKAISSSAAKRLLPLCRENSWLFDSELLAFATKEKLRVHEVPVRWVEHRDTTRRGSLRLWRDGWVFLLGLAKIRKRVFGQA